MLSQITALGTHLLVWFVLSCTLSLGLNLPTHFSSAKDPREHEERFRLKLLTRVVARSFWQDSLSQHLMDSFFRSLTATHSYLHPLFVIVHNAGGTLSNGDSIYQCFWSNRCNLQTMITSAFHGLGLLDPAVTLRLGTASMSDTFAVLCRTTGVSAELIRMYISSTIAELTHTATSSIHEVALRTPEVSQTDTLGMPSAFEVYLDFLQELERAFVSLTTSQLPGCHETASDLAGIVTNFSQRMPLFAAAFHTALLHSSVHPNSSPGVRQVSFHMEAGVQRFEVLASLLSMLQKRDSSGSTDLMLEAVEIGVESGYTSAFLLERVPTLRLLSVDPYPGERLIQYEAVKRMLHRYGERSSLWRNTSYEAARSFTGTLDLVFIDGDHSYASVKDDILLWAPKVRPGGIVAGHDYHCMAWEDVGKAVHEAVHEAGAVLHLGSDFMWWYHVSGT